MTRTLSNGCGCVTVVAIAAAIAAALQHTTAGWAICAVVLTVLAASWVLAWMTDGPPGVTVCAICQSRLGPKSTEAMIDGKSYTVCPPCGEKVLAKAAGSETDASR